MSKIAESTSPVVLEPVKSALPQNSPRTPKEQLVTKLSSAISKTANAAISSGTSLANRVIQCIQSHPFFALSFIAGMIGSVIGVRYFLTDSPTILPTCRNEGPIDWSQCGLVPSTPDFFATHCLAEHQCLIEPTNPFNPPLLPPPESPLQPKCLPTQQRPLYPILSNLKLDRNENICPTTCNQSVERARKKIALLKQAMRDGAETPPSLEELDKMLDGAETHHFVSSALLPTTFALLTALALKCFRATERAFDMAQIPDPHLDRPWRWGTI